MAQSFFKNRSYENKNPETSDFKNESLQLEIYFPDDVPVGKNIFQMQKEKRCYSTPYLWTLLVDTCWNKKMIVNPNTHFTIAYIGKNVLLPTEDSLFNFGFVKLPTDWECGKKWRQLLLTNDAITEGNKTGISFQR